MLPTIEIILRRSITLDHPRWTFEPIVAAVREALQGRGDYAFLAADLLAAESAETMTRRVGQEARESWTGASPCRPIITARAAF